MSEAHASENPRLTLPSY